MDIALKSTGNGGEYTLLSNDIATTSELYNQVYLALFGGNVEGSTKRKYAKGEFRLDWFANSVLFPENLAKQMNSETERELRNVSLTTSGRVRIEQAITRDTAYLSELGKTTSRVIFSGHNKIIIEIKIEEPAGAKTQNLTFVWDTSKEEVINNETI